MLTQTTYKPDPAVKAYEVLSLTDSTLDRALAAGDADAASKAHAALLKAVGKFSAAAPKTPYGMLLKLRDVQSQLMTATESYPGTGCDLVSEPIGKAVALAEANDGQSLIEVRAALELFENLDIERVTGSGVRTALLAIISTARFTTGRPKGDLLDPQRTPKGKTARKKRVA